MAMAQIRRGNKRDEGRLIELRSELYAADNRHFGDVNADWPRSRGGRSNLRSYLNPDHLCVVFDEGSLVTGYLLGMAKEQNAAMVGWRAELDEIYVAEDSRRQGHGSALLAEFTAWWQAEGADLALVSVFAPNTESQAFFAHNGYEPYLARLQHRSGGGA